MHGAMGGREGKDEISSTWFPVSFPAPLLWFEGK